MALAQNLIPYSEDYSQVSAWTVSNLTRTPNALANPVDGTVNATLFTDTVDGGATAHTCSMVTTLTRVGDTLTVSMYAKAGTGGRWLLVAPDAGAKIVYFDLTNGVIGTSSGIVSAAIESRPGGWYRCSVTYTKGSTGELRIYVSNGNASYTGTGSINLYLFGVQCARANWPGPYVATTTKPIDNGNIRNIMAGGQNLIKASQNITDASWTTDATATAATVSIVDPFGLTSTCSRLTCAGGGAQYVRGASYNPAGAAGTYTMSAWVKTVGGGSQNFQLNPTLAAAYSGDLVATGTWTRKTYTVTVAANASTVFIRNGTANGALDIYLYGIQIVQSDTPGGEILTSGTAYNPYGPIRSLA